MDELVQEEHVNETCTGQDLQHLNSPTIIVKDADNSVVKYYNDTEVVFTVNTNNSPNENDMYKYSTDSKFIFNDWRTPSYKQVRKKINTLDAKFKVIDPDEGADSDEDQDPNENDGTEYEKPMTSAAKCLLLLDEHVADKLERRLLLTFGRKLINIPLDKYNCVFQSVLCQVKGWPTTYKPIHLRRQMVEHFIDNVDDLEPTVRIDLIAQHRSVFQWCRKMLSPMAMVDTVALFVLRHMLGAFIVTLCPTSVKQKRLDKLQQLDIGYNNVYSAVDNDKNVADADIVLVYNGIHHYAGTYVVDQSTKLREQSEIALNLLDQSASLFAECQQLSPNYTQKKGVQTKLHDLVGDFSKTFNFHCSSDENAKVLQCDQSITRSVTSETISVKTVFGDFDSSRGGNSSPEGHTAGHLYYKDENGSGNFEQLEDMALDKLDNDTSGPVQTIKELNRQLKGRKETNRYFCDTCDMFPQGWTRSNDLKNHKLTKHTEGYEAGIPCAKGCGLVFRTLQGMGRHVSTKHLNKYLHDCKLVGKDGCKGKKTNDEEIFKHHLYKVHKIGSPTICPNCKKEIGGKRYLQTHLKKCGSAQGFTSSSNLCSECGKMFSTSSNLRKHMKRHQKPTSMA